MRIAFLLGLLLFASCSLKSFEEVSAPYVEQYGQPEEVTDFWSGLYHQVDWWYWTKGFNVSFGNDNGLGWYVESEYRFDPIK